MINIKLKKQKGKIVTITDVNSLGVVTQNSMIQNKVAITFCDDQGRKFHASNLWIRNKGIRPLSYHGENIHQWETLGRLLFFLKAESTEDLIGKRIYAYPDPKGYLIPVCFEPFLIEYKNNN